MTRCRTPSLIELQSTVDRFQSALDDWSLSRRELGGLLGVAPATVAGRGSWRFGRLDRRAERRMRLLLRMERVALSLLSPGDRFGAWLRTPNPGLRSASPIDCLLADADALDAILRLLVDEHRTAYGADAAW